MRVCVAVFSRKPEDVKDLMERYDELGGQYGKYCVFEPVDESDPEYPKFLAEFEKEKEASKIPPTYEQFADGDTREPAVIRADYEDYLAGYKPFETFDEYMRETYTSYRYNERNGKYGFFYKPTQRVTYWTDDSGCSRVLHLKNGEKVSQAQLKDISLEPMGDEVHILERIWEIYVEGQQPIEGEEKQEYAKAVKEKIRIYSKEKFYREELLMRYSSKENFLFAHTCFIPWSVLTPDGEWYEVGSFMPLSEYLEEHLQENKDEIDDDDIEEASEGMFLEPQGDVLDRFREMFAVAPELWLTVLDCRA